MVKCFAVIACILVSFQAHAGYRANLEGATQQEREIRWVWKYLNEFVVSCAASSIDCQDPEVRKVVLELAAYLPSFDSASGATWSGLLHFVSEREKPGSFSSALGEAHRTVMTGLTKFSDVLVNSDRMDQGLSLFVGLLTHESVHHLGYLDDQKRMPDRVGAEIAKHFARQIQTSSLEQFNAANVYPVMFNSAADNHPAVGFFSWGMWSSDLNWGSSTAEPICQPSETIAKEFVSAPSWRINRFRLSQGIVSIRGGGYVKASCRNSAGQVRFVTLPLNANVDLQYPVPFDRENWLDQTPKAVHDNAQMIASFNANDVLFGQAQTFFIHSTQFNRPKLSAGDTWAVQLKVHSIDGFQPTLCQAYAAGMQYSFVSQDGLPGVNPFDSCKIQPGGAPGEWIVYASLVMPKNARPDSYYLPVVRFSDGNSDRVAIQTTPTMILLENPTAPPPPVIRSIQMPGLERATHLGTLDLTNSCRVDPEEQFEIQFVVEGKVKPTSDLWFDVDLWFLGSGEFGIANGTGSSISLPQVLTSTRMTPVANGTLVTMSYTMPTVLQGMFMAGIKFRRFYVRTEDFSWVEIEMPGLHDSMVVSSSFGF